MGIDRGGKGREIVAAFESREDAALGVAFCDACHYSGQICVARFGEPHTCQWIVFVRIESGRNEYELRLELVCRRHQRFEKDRMVFVVVPAGLHWYIDRKPLTGSLPPLGGATRSGIVRILVGAEKEDGGIVLEAVLRSVAVMYIPVDDQHALQPVSFLDIAG